MFQLLCAVSRVDPWECYQDTWQTTCSVLEHHRDLMKVRVRLLVEFLYPSLPAVSMETVCKRRLCRSQRVTGCILSNVNTPSLMPVIGQPQNQAPPIYRSNIKHTPTASESCDHPVTRW